MNEINCIYYESGVSARGRLRNALIADSEDFAPTMGGDRFQMQTEDQEEGMHDEYVIIIKKGFGFYTNLTHVTAFH